MDHDESSVQAVSFNYLRAEWKVPLQYPFSTPSVPLQYPFSTPSVPLQYPFSTPSVPLKTTCAPSGRSVPAPCRRASVAAWLVACCTHTAATDNNTNATDNNNAAALRR